MEQTINIKLKIWRQRGPKEPGQFVDYSLDNVPTNISFLEMLDMLNEQLVEKGEEPVVFDNDCREGICGMCSLYINGNPHGPVGSITTCQLHMRKFNDGDTITIEPWRSHAFPVIRDLMVDRSAYDKIQQAGGYVSFNTGGAGDANLSQRRQPTRQWTQLPASVAVPAWQLARTVRLCCLFQRRSASSHFSHKARSRQHAASALW